MTLIQQLYTRNLGCHKYRSNTVILHWRTYDNLDFDKQPIISISMLTWYRTVSFTELFYPVKMRYVILTVTAALCLALVSSYPLPDDGLQSEVRISEAPSLIYLSLFDIIVYYSSRIDGASLSYYCFLLSNKQHGKATNMYLDVKISRVTNTKLYEKLI